MSAVRTQTRCTLLPPGSSCVADVRSERSLPLCGQHPSICPPVCQRDSGGGGEWTLFSPFADELDQRKESPDLCCVTLHLPNTQSSFLDRKRGVTPVGWAVFPSVPFTH